MLEIGSSPTAALYYKNVEQFNTHTATMKEYIPQPADTSNVTLPEELKPLVEEMSKNVHEVWAQTRISQGWTYGKERNDTAKLHPCLLPYDKLSEDEKTYDRNTSIETIKLILKLGFKISRD